MVHYLLDNYSDVTFKKDPVPRRGFMQLAPGQGEDGYGKKISTDYMVRVNGRWQRIYCICFSNVGSLYVLIQNKKYFIRGYEIEEGLENSLQ